MNSGGPFLVTGEYRRFAEFCDACRQYRYIGLCHGPAGVGKTLSARHYAAWDRFESLPAVWHADDQALAAFNDADTIFYTPEIVNSPRAVESDVARLCNKLHGIREEPRHRAEKIAAQARWAEERRQQDERFLEMDWFAPRDPDDEASSTPSVPEIARVAPRPRLAPARLILVDEADRLKVPSLEQLRDLFDRSEIGLVLIGMPGIEKRLARYPQLYSRIGFVHAFRSLRAEEIRRLFTEHWPEMGLALPASGITDEEAIAAIIRITGGNFRLLRRLLSQVERLLGINQLREVTVAVVEAAREGLVIGTA
jgi:DNA transposition AAA+ family ATPase